MSNPFNFDTGSLFDDQGDYVNLGVRRLGEAPHTLLQTCSGAPTIQESYVACNPPNSFPNEELSAGDLLPLEPFPKR